MKKAVFYGRYSSANQTEQSIEGQLHVCEKFAAENDIEITAHYIDRAMSATSDKRPQFQQMIADSRHGSFLIFPLCVHLCGLAYDRRLTPLSKSVEICRPKNA